MNQKLNSQINKILQQTENELSKFQSIIRPVLNSRFSDKFSNLLNIVFEPKTLTISLLISILVFYGIFFNSVFIGAQVNPSLILSCLIPTYILLRTIKAIKNKIAKL